MATQTTSASPLVQLITDLKSRLSAINTALASGNYSKDLYAVHAQDTFYTVELEGRNCKVGFNIDFPVATMQRYQADDIAANFKASNGNGPLVWEVVSYEQYLTLLDTPPAKAGGFLLQRPPTGRTPQALDGEIPHWFGRVPPYQDRLKGNSLVF